MDGEQGQLDALRARVAELESELAAQKDAARRLDAVLVAVPSIVMHLDAELRFLGISRPVAGYSEEQVRGSPFLSHVPESEKAEVERVLRSVLDSKKATSFSTVGPGPNGMTSFYESYVAPVASDDGQSELIVVAIDVTSQRQRDDALRERDTIISVACDATGIGIWVLDILSNRVTWNLGMHTLTGVDVPLALDAYRDRIVHPDDRDHVANPYQRGEGTSLSVQTGPYRIIRPNGDLRWVMTSGRLHRNDAGEPETLIGATVDVTEHRIEEAARAHAERLAAVGRLAAGIAHNFNNHLATMLPVLEMIRSENRAPREELLDDAIHAGRRGADLVRQLLAYSRRRDPGALVPERFESVVERAIAMCKTLLDRTVSLGFESRAKDAYVACDAGAIEQAVVNLVVNARDAIASTSRASGSIRVTLELESVEGGTFVLLRVADDGAGMDATTRERLFEPFYTTKDAGRGTGLGLSITYATVESHGGTIACESSDAHGTTFVLRFPTTTVAQAAEVAGSGPRRDSLRSRPMRILLCDDDEGVREVVATWLDHMGHEVESAADVGQALERLGSIPARDLILLDRSLLGVRTGELIARLRAAAPSAFIVYFTGDDVPDDEIVLVDHLLSKPPSERSMDAMLEALFGS